MQVDDRLIRLFDINRYKKDRTSICRRLGVEPQSASVSDVKAKKSLAVPSRMIAADSSRNATSGALASAAR